MDISYSRLSCYRQCPRKFDLHYNQKIETYEPPQIDTLRGICLHEFAETIGVDSSYDIKKHISSFEIENNSRFSCEEKEKIKSGAERIQKLYSEYITFYIKKEYQLYPENEYIIDFHGHRLVTKIDILLLKRGSAVIIDLKTGQSTDPKYYTEQLAFYKKAISVSYTISEYAIQTKVCFLLAPVKTNQLKEFLIDIPISQKYYNKCQQNMLDTIKEIETNPKTTPKLSKMCEFCEYRKICDIAQINRVK